MAVAKNKMKQTTSLKIFGKAITVLGAFDDDMAASLIVSDMLGLEDPDFKERAMRSFDRFGNPAKRDEVLARLNTLYPDAVDQSAVAPGGNSPV